MSRADLTGARAQVVAGAPRPFPRKAVLWTGGLVAAYLALLAVCDVGVQPGERMYRPNPLPPAPTQTFLGLRDITWFPIMYCVSGLVLGAILWWLARHLRATGQAHPAIGVLLAFLLLSLADPLISWGSYTAYNPELIHFPTDWPWFNLAPTVQTSWVTGAYSLFYMVPTLAGLWFWRSTLARRARPDSVIRRHPVASSWVFGTLFGFAYDIPSESFLINMNIWHYSQWWGSVVSIGTATVPLTEALWTGLLIGTSISVIQLDDRGRSRVAAALARRPLARRARLGDLGVIVALLVAVYAGYVASFTVIRVLDLSDKVESQWAFSTSKVYDPYGDAAAGGIPGPYYQGVGAWKLGGDR